MLSPDSCFLFYKSYYFSLSAFCFLSANSLQLIHKYLFRSVVNPPGLIVSNGIVASTDHVSNGTEENDVGNRVSSFCQKGCLSKVLIDENLSKLCKCKKCFAKESNRIFYIKLINLKKNACYLFSLSRKTLPIISQEWAGTGTLAFAKNFAKKFRWKPCDILAITPSSDFLSSCCWN
jgi:hypothetical protein